MAKDHRQIKFKLFYVAVRDVPFELKASGEKKLYKHMIAYNVFL
jgi:hypothetical protein